jgi:hypothetical protein
MNASTKAGCRSMAHQKTNTENFFITRSFSLLSQTQEEAPTIHERAAPACRHGNARM